MLYMCRARAAKIPTPAVFQAAHVTFAWDTAGHEYECESDNGTDVMVGRPYGYIICDHDGLNCKSHNGNLQSKYGYHGFPKIRLFNRIDYESILLGSTGDNTQLVRL